MTCLTTVKNKHILERTFCQYMAVDELNGFCFVLLESKLIPSSLHCHNYTNSHKSHLYNLPIQLSKENNS